jgi:hypothetical protein
MAKEAANYHTKSKFSTHPVFSMGGAATGLLALLAAAEGVCGCWRLFWFWASILGRCMLFRLSQRNVWWLTSSWVGSPLPLISTGGSGSSSRGCLSGSRHCPSQDCRRRLVAENVTIVINIVKVSRININLVG